LWSIGLGLIFSGALVGILHLVNRSWK
jgi:hypothetical protein